MTAAERSPQRSRSPDGWRPTWAGRNTELLRLYALLKQGSQGDVEGKRPGRFDMVNRAKYDAWATLAVRAVPTPSRATSTW
ncbi:possible acyl-CoA-binding protein (plasmid) [Rhodococcus jostii RHA1]|uniref:Possible acyl-CoA-binding protein n=2 Tax=Rhodococcus TaxID=1827 RepID=Q0RYQ4_RHOJR|nr:acyl-CoA-binding protein [Rhodococcus opacus]ABG99582.1 possible acyl-CoA-binding protein [Rhodococcus jostii RHA1]EID79238.1 acyl-CoA-binding protein [Rhodococcus opacus RKJ300 = JCM 13270]